MVRKLIKISLIDGFRVYKVFEHSFNVTIMHEMRSCLPRSFIQHHIYKCSIFCNYFFRDFLMHRNTPVEAQNYLRLCIFCNINSMLNNTNGVACLCKWEESLILSFVFTNRRLNIAEFCSHFNVRLIYFEIDVKANIDNCYRKKSLWIILILERI